MTTEERDTWEKLNKCKCAKKVFGSFIPGDLGWNTELCAYVEVNGIMGSHPEILWIPSLYDSIRPERSLIGIFATLFEKKRFTRKTIERILRTIIRLDRPDLALARVIIGQEGK
jgi:hypothetical protein